MIVRVASRVRGFTQVDNRTLRDDRLSFKARGILAFLLSHPDETVVNADDLVGAGPDGRDSIRSAFGELEHAGYLTREKHQGVDGRWRTELTAHERPSGDGLSDDTDAGKPVVGPTSTDDPNPQVAPTTGEPTVGLSVVESFKTLPEDSEQQQPAAAAGMSKPTPKAEGRAAKTLIVHGVRPPMAYKLVRELGAERCLAVCAWWPAKLKQDPTLGPGALVAAVRENWDAPDAQPRPAAQRTPEEAAEYDAMQARVAEQIIAQREAQEAV